MIVAGLSQYKHVWVKSLQFLETLNCGIEGGKVHQVLWRAHNLPVVKALKKCCFILYKQFESKLTLLFYMTQTIWIRTHLFVLYGTSNLNQNSPDGITDVIIEVQVLLNLNMVPSVFSFVIFSYAITVGQGYWY